MAADFDALRDELGPQATASPRELSSAAAEDWEVLQRGGGATPRSGGPRAPDHSSLESGEPADLGGSSLKDLLVHRLRISSAEAGRAHHRRPTTGAATGTHRPAAATAVGQHRLAAQAEGRIGDEHIQIIYATLNKKLPAWTDGLTRDQAEHTLASIACTLDPEQLQAAADRLILLLKPTAPNPPKVRPGNATSRWAGQRRRRHEPPHRTAGRPMPRHP